MGHFCLYQHGQLLMVQKILLFMKLSTKKVVKTFLLECIMNLLGHVHHAQQHLFVSSLQRRAANFLIADGRRMFRDLDPDLVEELYTRGIRYSVMELPFFGWIDNLPEPVQGPVMGGVKGLVSAAINAKVDFSVEMLWGQSGYDNKKMLQARSPGQPPLVKHPVTGEPTWFCNVHSHSSVLRKNRESLYGAERFEDGASQINKSDMFFGDYG